MTTNPPKVVDDPADDPADSAGAARSASPANPASPASPASPALAAAEDAGLVETHPAGTTSTYDAKSAALVGIIGALGVVLAFLSTFTLPIGPGLSVDLSHVGTYLVAIAGGPILGLMTGAIVGIVPAFAYSNPALIPGKMLTGAFVGLVYHVLKRRWAFEEHKLARGTALVAAGLAGYLPEFVFTVWDMRLLVGIPDFVVVTVLPKAMIEIIVISLLTAGLFNVPAVRDEMGKIVPETPHLAWPEYLACAALLAFTGVEVAWILVVGPAAVGSALWVTFWVWLGAVGIAAAALVATSVLLARRGK